MVEPNCSHDISTPKAFFFLLFRICCWEHSVVTLPITKSRYSFIGCDGVQQTSGTGWRFRTTDSDGAAFSRVITHEPAAGQELFTSHCCFLSACVHASGPLPHGSNPITPQSTRTMTYNYNSDTADLSTD